MHYAKNNSALTNFFVGTKTLMGIYGASSFKRQLAAMFGFPSSRRQKNSILTVKKKKSGNALVGVS